MYDTVQPALRTAQRLPARVLLRASCVFVGGVLFLAAVLKLLIFNTFAVSTGVFLGVPSPLDSILAALVLGTEGIVGGALLLNRATRLFATVAAALLVGFILVLARADATGLVAPCNCFGSTSLNLPYRSQIVFDLGLLAAALTVVVLSPARHRSA